MIIKEHKVWIEFFLVFVSMFCYVCVRICVHVHVKARGQLQMPFDLVLWFSLVRSSPIWLGWLASETQGSACLYPSSAGIAGSASIPSFNMGAVDWTS